MHVAQKLEEFTKRIRTITEKYINDVLFELEMQEELTSVSNTTSVGYVASSLVSTPFPYANSSSWTRCLNELWKKQWHLLYFNITFVYINFKLIDLQVENK